MKTKTARIKTKNTDPEAMRYTSPAWPSNSTGNRHGSSRGRDRSPSRTSGCRRRRRWWHGVGWHNGGCATASAPARPRSCQAQTSPHRGCAELANLGRTRELNRRAAANEYWIVRAATRQNGRGTASLHARPTAAIEFSSARDVYASGTRCAANGSRPTVRCSPARNMIPSRYCKSSGRVTPKNACSPRRTVLRVQAK
jgi:hypothetical protein